MPWNFYGVPWNFYGVPWNFCRMPCFLFCEETRQRNLVSIFAASILVKAIFAIVFQTKEKTIPA